MPSTSRFKRLGSSRSSFCEALETSAVEILTQSVQDCVHPAIVVLRQSSLVAVFVSAAYSRLLDVDEPSTLYGCGCGGQRWRGIANGISFGPVSIHGLSPHEIRPQRRGASAQGGCGEKTFASHAMILANDSRLQ